jgi:outer membrane protein OmpA-like peptidoglycan-associated protein
MTKSFLKSNNTLAIAMTICVSLTACTSLPSLFGKSKNDTDVGATASANATATNEPSFIVVAPKMAIESKSNASAPFFIVVPATPAAKVPEVAIKLAEIASPALQLKMAPALDSLKYAIFFDYATANLNSTGKAAVDALVQDAKVSEAIEIIGRADPTGNKLLNDKLAMNRAKAVRQALLTGGVTSSKFALVASVGNSDLVQRTALRQNIPVDSNAVSRRSDVNMAIQPSKVTTVIHKDFASIPS